MLRREVRDAEGREVHDTEGRRCVMLREGRCVMLHWCMSRTIRHTVNAMCLEACRCAVCATLVANETLIARSIEPNTNVTALHLLL